MMLDALFFRFIQLLKQPIGQGCPQSVNQDGRFDRPVYAF
jgi:hypothetical protein